MPIGMFAGSIGRDGEGFGIFHHIVEGIVCIDADDAVQMGEIPSSLSAWVVASCREVP